MSFSGILSGIVLCIIGLFSLTSVRLYDVPSVISIPIAIALLGTGLYMILTTSKEDAIEGIRKK